MSSDVYSVDFVPPSALEVSARARASVRRFARDAEDESMLLSALGLVEEER